MHSGVMPLISRLDTNQAMYYFLSGYTQASLQALSAALLSRKQPFLRVFWRSVHAPPTNDIRNDAGRETDAKWLKRVHGQHWLDRRPVRSWKAGKPQAYQSHGLRSSERSSWPCIPISLIRFQADDAHGMPGVPCEILDPRGLWKDREAYDRAAHALAARVPRQLRQVFM